MIGGVVVSDETAVDGGSFSVPNGEREFKEPQ